MSHHFYIKERCLRIKYNKEKLKDICPCTRCAGPPQFGRFRCVIKDLTGDELKNASDGYIPSKWEKEQNVRIKKSRIYEQKQNNKGKQMNNQDINYLTVSDAGCALTNSGVNEWFCDFSEEELSKVFEWMWRNNKSPEEAAKYFEVD